MKTSNIPTQPLIVFLHIPKTAGTSFLGTLRNAFGDHRLIRLVSFGDGTADEIGRLVSDRPGDLACLIGHIPFHLLAAWRKQCSIFTILRHPIARVMSLYRFLQGRPVAEQKRLGLHPGFGFEAFITSRHPELFVQIHDGMCRMLCGEPEMSNPDSTAFWRRTPSAELVGRAVRNLESIDFGLAEQMDGTMRMARAAWGIPYDLATGRANTTDHKGLETDPSRALAIVARNAMDLALYQSASAMFASRLAWLESARGAPPGSTAVHRPTPGQPVAIGQVAGLQGFHEVEETGIAWLDHAQQASIHFDLPGDAARIRLHGYAFREDYPLDEIVIYLNGSVIPVRLTRSGPLWFDLWTPMVPIHHPLNVLGIRPPFFLPVRYFDPATADPRHLSIALANLTLGN